MNFGSAIPSSKALAHFSHAFGGSIDISCCVRCGHTRMSFEHMTIAMLNDIAVLAATTAGTAPNRAFMGSAVNRAIN